MTKTCGRYTPKEISRFIDGELSRQKIRQIRHHIDTCPACRDLAARFREATQSFTELAETPGMAIDPARLHQRLEQPADKPGTSWIARFSSRPALPLLVAAASIAALVFISVYALKNDGPIPAGPSALVTSIETEYTAVMIFETPDTHHTIIWYSET
jgi:anti-sigma factor RsiW